MAKLKHYFLFGLVFPFMVASGQNATNKLNIMQVNSPRNGNSVLNFSENKKTKRLIPAPTNRNFALVVAPLGGFSMPSQGGFGTTAQISTHFYKPAFALDLYYEGALQDFFRSKMVKANTYLKLDHFYNRMEANFSLTYSSKVGMKNSLFYTGQAYYGGTAYDLYSSGQGDAAKYRQLRFGISQWQLALPTDGLDSLPTKLEPFLAYSYYPKVVTMVNKNINVHVGFGFTKVYKTYSPSRYSGSDRIGMRKIYFDVFYSPVQEYHFLSEDGNSAYNGYLIPHVLQKYGGRFGWEVIRLNPFSGYYQFEVGVFPAVYPYDDKIQEGTYMLYISMKFGLSSGWSLFNWNYE